MVEVRAEPHGFQECEITWEDFEREYAQEAHHRRRPLIFGGQLEHHDLSPSLERAALRLGLDLENLPGLEDRLLRDFQRSVPAHTAGLPKPDDTLGWVALMQHHGALSARKPPPTGPPSDAGTLAQPKKPSKSGSRHCTPTFPVSTMIRHAVCGESHEPQPVVLWTRLRRG
jgi:hypothetical protein